VNLVLEHLIYANYVVVFTVYLLAICRFLFQQSNQLADMEKKYNFLQQEAEKFLDVENKVNLISEKVIIKHLNWIFSGEQFPLFSFVVI